MKRIITGIVIIGLCFAGITTVAADSKKEAAALYAAEKWLHLVDRQDYTESWMEAATLFKNAVQLSQWEHSMDTVRKPLGNLISRKVKMKVYKTALPGAPDGEYVVIQFDTSFQNKKKAVETVTPMLDKDGVWRVSGYYIR